MKKYIITDDVNTRLINPEKILWDGAGAALHIVPYVPAAGIVPLAALAVKWAMRNNAVVKITSVEQLQKYQNCISNEWTKRVLYVEHPHRKGVLIEASLYKDYILREMVADISAYIMDHLDLSKLVVGLIVTGRENAKAKVPVEQVNAEATMKCSLDNNYLYNLCDTHVVSGEGKEYVWISRFPDIVAAVEHQSGKMEIRKKVSLDMDIGVGLGRSYINSGGKKDFEFYISYVKAGKR